MAERKSVEWWIRVIISVLSAILGAIGGASLG